MANKIGRAKRTIQEDNQIGRLSYEAREVIRGTSLEDEKRLLLQISQVREPWQEPVARAMIFGKCRSAEAALRKLGLKDPRMLVENWVVSPPAWSK